MKVNEIRVDGFGVWQGLKLAELNDRITVFYGANEAGKTTLLQFVRAVLYGFSTERRERYLAKIESGPTGGALHVSAPGGEYVIRRRADRAHPQGILRIATANGRGQPEHLLPSLLSDVDEATFNNVFAVGLGELQQLGSLSDTVAAQWLYSLTSGLDRVSLVEVLAELRRSQRRLLDNGDRPSRVATLLGQRQRLAAEVESLSEDARRWTQLFAAREELQQQIDRTEAETERLRAEERAFEAAIAIREPWTQRAELDAQFAALGIGGDLADDGADRLLDLNDLLEKRQQRRKEIRRRRAELRDQARQLPINATLCRNGPRIEALAEQQFWIGSLEEEKRRAETELQRLRDAWVAESGQLGIPNGQDGRPVEITNRLISTLRGPARELRETKKTYLRAKQEAAAARVTAGAIESEHGATLKGRSEADVQKSLEEVGTRVNLLRKRVQVDERIDRMEHNRRELEEESLDLLDDQILPVWVIAALGGAFALGVLLIFAQLILPGTAVASFGWGLALLGIAGCAIAGMAKYVLERSAGQRLEDCHAQLELVERQLKQTKEEREALDKQIPQGGGQLASRLQKAEGELAELEAMLPSDTRRRTARDDAAQAMAAEKEAEEEYELAQEAWGDALVAVGLPRKMTPKQIQQLSNHTSDGSELRRRMAEQEDVLARRQRDYDGVARRVEQLLADAGIQPVGSTPVERIRELQTAYASQEKLFSQRNRLRRRYRNLKRKEKRYSENIAKLKESRRGLLREAGVTSEEEYQLLAAQRDQARQLRSRRNALSREIAAALGMHTTEEQVATCLAEDSERLEKRHSARKAQVETNEAQLKRWRTKLGELGYEQKALTDDRRLDERHLELSLVDEQLRAAIDAWQVRAVTSQWLETIRQEYEQHKQPETLIEASTYLKQLTAGRYTRVWTPLGEEVLYVDQHDGTSRSVDLLSRGTREQLFLSLRLALVSLYARRGAVLPLVLDDVLVNFDADRAKAAAAVLRDFAKAGHQLLVFTCHEHVWKMFKTMRLDARRLPNAADLQPVVEVEEEVLEPEVVEEPEPEPEPVAAIEQESELEDEYEYEEADEYVDDDYEYEDEYIEGDDEDEVEAEDEAEPAEAEADDEEEYELEDVEDEQDSEVEDVEEGYEVEEPEPVAVEEAPPEEDQRPLAELDFLEPLPDEPEPARRRGARGWEVEFESEWNDDTEAA